VIDAGPWTNQRIAAAHRTDRAAKESYYGILESKSSADPVQPGVASANSASLLGRLRHWLISLRR